MIAIYTVVDNAVVAVGRTDAEAWRNAEFWWDEDEAGCTIAEAFETGAVDTQDVEATQLESQYVDGNWIPYLAMP